MFLRKHLLLHVYYCYTQNVFPDFIVSGFEDLLLVKGTRQQILQNQELENWKLKLSMEGYIEIFTFCYNC